MTMQKLTITDASAQLKMSTTQINLMVVQGELNSIDGMILVDDKYTKLVSNTPTLPNEDSSPHIEIDKKASDKLKTKIGFNGLSGSEWAQLSKNVIGEDDILNEVWKFPTEKRNVYHLEHGAAYPVKLVERLIKMYSAKGNIIFDPFVGTGTTMVAAQMSDRSAIGIELTPKFFNVAETWVKDVHHKFPNDCTYTLLNDDCRQMKKYVDNNTVHCTITSPPYADFIHRSVKDRNTVHKNSVIKIDNNSTVKPYSDLDADFGNLPYDEFIKQIEYILQLNFEITVPGGYACYIVKDYRNTKNGVPYIPFHSDLANAAQRAGWKYHDLIIWNQAEQRRLVVLGFPSTLYSNQNCSFIVVLRKPTA